MQTQTSRPRHQHWLNAFYLLAIAALGLWGLYGLRHSRIETMGLGVVISAGVLGTWRWSWFGLSVLRSGLYRCWVFPRWRRRADRLLTAQTPSIGIVVPTFREQLWITERVFGAIAHEAQTLPHRLTLVAVTTAEEIVAIEAILRAIDPQLHKIDYIPLLDSGTGKRKALAEGLRRLAATPIPPEIVCLMDGDAIISEGAVRKCLPFFRLFPRLGGLTTDEKATVDGSKLFGEWLDLRFAQRHLYMCSHALSRKILCLTGRYSLYRAEAALDPSFAHLLENDTLQDWLWGEFKFLSGDDKSTWYWLLKQGYEMIYVPDVMVETIETVSGNVPLRMYQNMRRWFGNMLRNGSRAMALGPGRVGWYPWYCLLDQRISFWTALIAPTLLIIYAVCGKWRECSVILCWLLFTRPLSLLIFGWGRDEVLKPIHIALTLLSQWSSSLVKIYTQMNLAQQKWSNRGNQSRSVGSTGLARSLQKGTAQFLLIAQGLSFVFVLLWLVGDVAPQVALPAWWWRHQVQTIEQPVQILQAIEYGVKPDDATDDTPALQAMLNQLPPQGLTQINLPPGELLLTEPLTLSRPQTVLKGQGQSRTILHLVKTESSQGQITIASETGEPIGQVKVSRLTLLQDSSQGAALVVRSATNLWLNQLQFRGNGTHALILDQTTDTHLEFLAFEGKFSESPIAWRNSTLKGQPVVSSRTVK
ncbi:glycosyltransferase [Phormidesmis priestleyi]